MVSGTYDTHPRNRSDASITAGDRAITRKLNGITQARINDHAAFPAKPEEDIPSPSLETRRELFEKSAR